jgi:hypothetical protein
VLDHRLYERRVDRRPEKVRSNSGAVHDYYGFPRRRPFASNVYEVERFPIPSVEGYDLVRCLGRGRHFAPFLGAASYFNR